MLDFYQVTHSVALQFHVVKDLYVFCIRRDYTSIPCVGYTSYFIQFVFNHPNCPFENVAGKGY